MTQVNILVEETHLFITIVSKEFYLKFYLYSTCRTVHLDSHIADYCSVSHVSLLYTLDV